MLTMNKFFLASLLSAPLLVCAPLHSAQAMTPTTEAAQAEYRLGGGDVIRISVYQSQDLSLETRLSETGVISFPLVGALMLGGKTVGEAEQVIAAALKKGEFVKNPQVNVVLMQARGSQVSVLGQVNRPGRFALENGGTKLSDVLAQAGGVVANQASDEVVVVGTRDGQAFRKVIDLPEVLDGRRRYDDIVLQGGDVIYVERAPVVYIYGEVQRPGQLRLDRGMTLLQGLAAGGGLTQRGTDRGIRIHRRNEAGQVEEIQPRMTDTLRAGDVIFVRESLF
ncbi:polysaccharide export protein EpsE [Ideonella paludis]|uniref:Polysaccharide export protein EpsE n=2 Tax=Ideonella paludis TaxID=1233411 RepID=A0ABS5DRE2_9BURK|nr:polysaccharide export protein EpsE [Ideonella paludis]